MVKVRIKLLTEQQKLDRAARKQHESSVAQAYADHEAYKTEMLMHAQCNLMEELHQTYWLTH